MKAIITGGSKGIGKKIATALLEEGVELIILARNQEQLERTVFDLQSRDFNQQVVGKVCDVSVEEQVKDAFRYISDASVLVNCAGILGPVGPFEENSMPDFKRTIEVNLLGTVYCCNYAIPILRRSITRPKIINVSGGGAAYPRMYHTAYAASKAAVVRFTENIAQENKAWVDINAIAPGAHKTEMWDGETYEKEPEEWADDSKLFGLVKYLSGKKSDGVTGRFIHICNDWEKFTPEISGTDNYTLRHKKE